MMIVLVHGQFYSAHRLDSHELSNNSLGMPIPPSYTLLFNRGSGFQSERPAMTPRNFTNTIAIAVLCLLSGGLQKQTEHVLELHVIDKTTKEPIADAAVSIAMSNVPSRKDGTDTQGRCWIILPTDKTKYLRLIARHDGYVETMVEWQSAGQLSIPAAFTLALEPGTPIGGIIRNEQGQPIEGANVSLVIGRGIEDEQRPSPRESKMVNYVDCKTDQDGKWVCDSAPLDIKKMSIRLSHPLYVTDNESGEVTSKPPAQNLRDMTAVLVMKKGIELTGIIQDKDAKPIKGATVLQGMTRFMSNHQETKTDTDGRFTFPSARAGAIDLTITAKNFALLITAVDVKRDMAALHLKLEPGNILRGKVLDIDGKSVPGATLAVEYWRGRQVLAASINTDATGQFIWTEAPADEVQFTVYKRGFQYLRYVKMTAGKNEYLLTLRRPLHVVGSVVDAETNQPLDKFKVILGQQWEPNQVYFDPRNAAIGSAGKYAVDLDEPAKAHLLHVEADGYLPQVSRQFKDDEAYPVLDFKLKKGSGPRILVKLPNGQPAAGAEVAIYSIRGISSFQILNGHMPLHPAADSATIAKTDTAGAVSFPPQTDGFTLLAIHDAGCAEASEEQLKPSGEIKLQPWVAVDAKFMIGSRPAASQTVELWRVMPVAGGRIGIFFQHTATTDAEGRIKFARVVPGDWIVRRILEVPQDGAISVMPLNSERTGVSPGQTVQITVGGTGRPVIGRGVLPAGAALPDGWKFGDCRIITRDRRPTLPANWQQLSDAQRQLWYQQWNGTEEAKAIERNRHYYPVFPAKDGSFRVDDVVPGDYSLILRIDDSNAGSNAGFVKPMAQLAHEFTLPEIPGGRTDEPHDLGQIQLKLRDETKPIEKE